MIHSTILLAAEAAAEGGGGLFDFDATLPIMAIQFLILAALLNTLFYKPIGKAIDDRDALIRNSMTDAKDRLSKSEALAKQYEQELADARRATQKLISDAEGEAQQIASQQMAEAQKEAQVQREQAQQELDQQKQTAMQSLEQQVDSLSQQILQKLLGTASVG